MSDRFDSMTDEQLDAFLTGMQPKAESEEQPSSPKSRFDDMSDEELDNFLNLERIKRSLPREQQEAQAEEGRAEAALIGLGAGMKAGIENIEFAAKDIGAFLGIVDKEELAEEKREAISERAQFSKLPIAKKFPITTTVAKVTGELAPALIPAGKAASGAARLLGGGTAGVVASDVAAGAVVGALSDVEDRGRGALVGGVTGGAGGAVVRGVTRAVTGTAKAVSGVASRLKAGKENAGLIAQLEGQADDLVKSIPSKNPESGYGGVLSESMQAVHKKASQRVANMFDEVYTKTDKLAPFKLDNARKVAGEQLAELKAVGIDVKSGSELEKLFMNIINQPAKGFKDQHLMRQLVDAKFNKFKSALKVGGTDKFQFNALTKVRKAVEQDIEAAAKKAGQGKSYMKAKETYQNLISRFDDGINAKVIEGKADIDALVSAISKTDGKQTAKQLVAALDGKGKVALKNGIIRKLYNDASVTGKFKMEDFMKKVRKMNDSLGLVTDRTTAKTMQGMVKLHDKIVQSSQFVDKAEAARTGVKVAVAGSISRLAGLRVLANALASPKGVKVIQKAGEMPKNSPKLDEIVKQFIIRAASQEAAKAVSERNE